MLRMTPLALAMSMLALPQWAFAQTTSNQDAATEQTLPAVKVSAAAEQSAELPAPYAGGQVARGARLGALGNQSVMDTPFNITSYTAELIENQQARSVADVMANDPSVRFTTSSGHAYENFRVRGFDVNSSELAINGVFGLAPVGHAPLEAVERVEVLKGPSALFSGMPPGGGVGGVINLVPKRAGDDPLTRVSLGYQSAGQVLSSFDVGRRGGAQNAFGARVNGAFSNGDTELDGQSKKRQFLSGAFDYRGDALTASLDAYYNKESFSGGTPAMYWFQNSTPIPSALDPRKNMFPGASGELESKAVIARAEYEFNPHLTAFASAGVMNFEQTGFINGTHARNIAVNGNFTAATNGTRSYTDSVAAEAGLRSRFATGAVGHEVVLHATGLEQESGSATNSVSTTSNIYNPVSSLVMPASPASAPKTSETTLGSLALVDTLSLLDDRLRVTVGLRNQNVKTTNYNASTGAVTAKYDKSAVTPALGVVVKPWGPSVSLYANYVQGLSKGDTVSDTLATNRNFVFAPYKTEQMEGGIKWEAGKFSNTLSLFEITKPTMVALGSATNPTYTDDGEKRVRGLEWNTFGELTRNLRVLGGIAYSQGVQTKTAYNRYDGNVAIGAPRWQGNLGTEWDVPMVSGLTLSGRVVTTSSQYLDAANQQRIPGWGIVDAGARYSTKLEGRPLVLRLTANNLFDKRYWSGSFSDSYSMATLGAPRTITASATMDF